MGERCSLFDGIQDGAYPFYGSPATGLLRIRNKGFGSRGDSLAVNLHEDLVVKIIARFSFPDIFKCRQLSKSWFSRFVAGSDDQYAKAFQDEVKSVSLTSWPTFGPIVKSYRSNFVSMYDGRRKKWRSLINPAARAITVSYPAHSLFVGPMRMTRIGHCKKNSYTRKENGSTIRVENMITRFFKILKIPSEGDHETAELDEEEVKVWGCIQLEDHRRKLGAALHVTEDGFIVVIFCYKIRNGTETEAFLIYDSRTALWEVNYVEPAGRPHRFFWIDICETLFKGTKLLVLYKTMGTLLSFDIVTKAVEQVLLVDRGGSGNWNDPNFSRLEIAICGSRRVIVGHGFEDPDDVPRRRSEKVWCNLCIFEYNEACGAVIEVTRHMVRMSVGGMVRWFGDDEHLYVVGTDERSMQKSRDTKIECYHFMDGTWTDLPIPEKPDGKDLYMQIGFISPGCIPFPLASSLAGTSCQEDQLREGPEGKTL